MTHSTSVSLRPIGELMCPTEYRLTGQSRGAPIGTTTMFLFDGPAEAELTVLLAHGAGAPMDSASLNAIAKALANTGLRVARFEFGYMASRRASPGKKPPPRAEMLKSEYIAAIDALKRKGPLVIGGKSMGGRVASMVADHLYASEHIAGLLCLDIHSIPSESQINCGPPISSKCGRRLSLCREHATSSARARKSSTASSPRQSRSSGLRTVITILSLARPFPALPPPITCSQWRTAYRCGPRRSSGRRQDESRNVQLRGKQ